MQNLILVMLSAVILMSLVDSQEGLTATSITECSFPKSRVIAPLWMCDANAKTAVGSAAKSEAGISFMEQMAVADARVNLVRNLHSSVQRKNTGDNNTPTSETIDVSMLNTALLNSTYGPDGTLYVLIGITNTSPKEN